MLGLAFKENCPDLRNTRVVDIVEALRGYDAQIDVHDPWVSAAECRTRIRHAAGRASEPTSYDAVIIAVGHRQFVAMGVDGIRALGKPSTVIYDVKYVLPRDAVDGEHPLTLYAATKKANEQMAHSYAHLYGIPSTGLRFFTVYGPWGRPDMALFLFTKAMLAGEPIKVFNHGKHKRSFTYVDDIVEGVVRTLDKVPGKNADWNGDTPDPSCSGVAPYRLYNIGNEQPVELHSLHRGAGAMLGLQSADGDASAASRRRARYRSRCNRTDTVGWLCAENFRSHRHRQLRKLVSRLLPRVV
jgi:nucleoside-diphosphate-sugar epimerase